MARRTIPYTLPELRAIKNIILIAAVFISCLDFQFESEYEDINGIYVENVQSYDYGGIKMIFNGDIAYIARAESLLIYDFTVIDSAVYLNSYCAANIIIDFQLYDGCAVLLTISDIEIVDLRDSIPNQLSIFLSPFSFGSSIRMHNDKAFVTSGNELHVVDISDKQHPILINSYDFAENIMQLEIDSNFAYIMSYINFYILDIQNPSTIDLVSAVPLGSLGIANTRTFGKYGDFVYFSSSIPTARILSTCKLTANHVLQPLGFIICPASINQLYISSQYSLAVSGYETYLLNVQYPFTPCISEVVDAGGLYGIIEENYIFLLPPDLHHLYVFEIKKVE
jgi:hypothetical protein